MRNKRVLIVAHYRMVLVLLLCINAIAVKGDNVIFTVSAPDTLEFGKPAKVIYRLHTNEYRNVKFPRFTNFNLLRYSYPPYDSFYNKTKFRDIEWSMEVTPYKSGSQTLPSMSVEINGERIIAKGKSIYVKGRGSQQDELMLKALQKYWNTKEEIYTPDYKLKQKIQKHATEASMASNLLNNKGQVKDNIWLSEIYANDEIIVFSDDWNLCFAIVATEKYCKYLSNPILAYSIESGGVKHDEMVKYYTEELKSLVGSNQKISKPSRQQYVAQKKNVKPLLGNMSWGPIEPYNNLLPTMKNKEKGHSNPAAVALAQIMGYHKFPQKGFGSHYYQIHKNHVFGSNFGSLTFNWDTMKDAYEKSDSDCLAAELIAANTYAIETEWPDDNYTKCTNMRNFKSALNTYFGYSNNCMLVNNVSNDLVASILYSELDNKRPVLCQGLAHYFVCDGYDADFFHFNMGLNGIFNGYYQIMFSLESTISVPMIESMLVGIEPSSKIKIVKNITLDKPGLLSSCLTEKERRDVTHLKISGKMNGEDMKIIRQMAGATEIIDFNSRPGSLSFLDLEEATFETDKAHPYLSKDASGYTYTTTSYTEMNGMRFNENTTTKNMYDVSHEDWRKIRRERIFKGKGYRFKEGDDSKFYVDFSMKKGIITPFLFENCDNLKEIKLPADTKSIEDGAFAFCNSLVNITLPPKVKSVTESAFMLCYNLEYVFFTSGSQPLMKESTHSRLSLGNEELAKGILTGVFAGNNPATCKGFMKKQ